MVPGRAQPKRGAAAPPCLRFTCLPGAGGSCAGLPPAGSHAAEPAQVQAAQHHQQLLAAAGTGWSAGAACTSGVCTGSAWSLTCQVTAAQAGGQVQPPPPPLLPRPPALRLA